jgi:uncharacterized protein (TIGR02186 family)
VIRVLALLAVLLLAGGARAPILVPEISQHRVEVRQGFTGADLLLFGAILDPGGTRAAQDYDIVVVLKGPVQSIVLREKRKVAGIWVNADNTEFRSAPSFFAIAASRPLRRIVDEKTAAIYELGLDRLQLSPIGAIAHWSWQTAVAYTQQWTATRGGLTGKWMRARCVAS